MKEEQGTLVGKKGTSEKEEVTEKTVEEGNEWKGAKQKTKVKPISLYVNLKIISKFLQQLLQDTSHGPDRTNRKC